jgi:hypothetical protein
MIPANPTTARNLDPLFLQYDLIVPARKVAGRSRRGPFARAGTSLSIACFDDAEMTIELEIAAPDL